MDVVTYVDERGTKYPALVTQVIPPEGEDAKPYVSVAFPNADSITDGYGTALSRRGYVAHKDAAGEDEGYWLEADAPPASTGASKQELEDAKTQLAATEDRAAKAESALSSAESRIAALEAQLATATSEAEAARSAQAAAADALARQEAATAPNNSGMPGDTPAAPEPVTTTTDTAPAPPDNAGSGA